MGLEFRHELRRELLDLNLRGVVLSRHGRLSRVAFAGVVFLVGLVSFPVWYGMVVFWGLADSVWGGGAYVVGIPFMAAMAAANAYPAMCIVVKRVHDADRSGHHAWWIMPVLISGAAAWSSGAEGLLPVAARILSLATVVLLLGVPGSPDTNSHGTVDYWG